MSRKDLERRLNRLRPANGWESWTDENNSDYLSTTIITTAASDSVKDIHHRMPVILPPHAHSDWLNNNLEDPNRLDQILQNKHVRDLRSYPVSKQVNTVANNHPDCIEPVRTQN